MYEPSGFRRDELGDIEIVEHDGRLHLFHLCLPSHDRIAHAVSEDGIRWEERPDALRVGPPGSFDDDMLWTMAVHRDGSGFVMLYTALSSADGGTVQRVGLAHSADLDTWVRRDEPVSVADPRWYTAEPGVSAPWVSWRDPTVFGRGRPTTLVVCAQSRAGPLHRRGAVARVETDGRGRFEGKPPLYEPRRDFELECPQVFELDGRFYLIASIQNDRSQRWFVSDTEDGPFRTPLANRLLPPGHYAARVFESRHGLAVCGWLRTAAAGGDAARHVLPTPSLLRATGDGRLRVEGWPAWAGREHGPARAWCPMQPRWDNPWTREDGEGCRVGAGQESWAAAQGPDGDFVLRGTFVLDAPLGGFVLGRRDGGAWLVELDRGEHRARLRSSGPARTSDDKPWFRDEIVQESVAALGDQAWDFELRVAGEELTFALDEAVVLQTFIDQRGGETGLWCDSGTVTARNASWRALTSV